MSLEVLNTNLSQLANPELAAKRTNTVENTKRETTEKVFSPNKYEEAKSVLVTEKLDDGKVLHAIDVRFQSNTPVAKLLNTVKVFNETELVKKTDDYKSSNHNGVVYRKESQVKTVYPWDYLSQFSDFGLTDNIH